MGERECSEVTVRVSVEQLYIRMRLGSWQICEDEDWELVTCLRTLMDGGKKSHCCSGGRKITTMLPLNGAVTRVSWYSKATYLDEGSGGVNVLYLEINSPTTEPQRSVWESPAGVALLYLIHVSMKRKDN